MQNAASDQVLHSLPMSRKMTLGLYELTNNNAKLTELIIQHTR